MLPGGSASGHDQRGPMEPRVSPVTLPHMDPHASNGFSMTAAPRTPYGCADSQRRLWEYLDEELPEDEAERVERHVATCLQCGPHATLGRRLLDRIAAVRWDRPEVAGLRERVAGVLAGLGRP
jgi:hypothetical protein